MRLVLRNGLVCLLWLVATLGPCWGDAWLTRTDLEHYGIHPEAFRLMTLSGDGHVLIGAERQTDLRKRAAGIGYLMRIFHFDGNVVTGVDTIELPVAIWDQTACNDDGTQAVISTEVGARIYEVDLQSHALRLLMERQPGQPGFRNDPRIEWFDGEKFYMVGYTYDGSGASGPEVIARLDLSQSGPAIFEPVVETMSFEKKTSPRWMMRVFYPPDQAVYMGPLRTGAPQELRAWYKGKASTIDSGIVYGTLAVTRDRVLYSVRRPGKIQHQEAWVRDLGSGDKWQVGKTDVPYQYGFISRDGKTVVLTVIDLAHRSLSMSYGREADQFTLRPVPGLTNVPEGNFRLAKDGHSFAYLTASGLRLGLLP